MDEAIRLERCIQRCKIKKLGPAIHWPERQLANHVPLWRLHYRYMRAMQNFTPHWTDVVYKNGTDEILYIRSGVPHYVKHCGCDRCRELRWKKVGMKQRGASSDVSRLPAMG